MSDGARTFCYALPTEDGTWNILEGWEGCRPGQHTGRELPQHVAGCDIAGTLNRINDALEAGEVK